MNAELPSLTTLILVELGVVALTAIATWRFAVYHFRRRKRSTSSTEPQHRLDQLEAALDHVAQEVDRLGESQDFVQELLTKRLTRLGLRPHAQAPPPQPSEHSTPV